MSELISIIMPAFNIQRHITFFKKALNGILNQTYDNWELLIISDGGFSVTTKKLVRIVSNIGDERIRLFKTTNQLGPGRTRNTAIRYARGKYLTFHDTDDYSEPNRLQLLMDNMDDDGIVASRVYVNFIERPTSNRTKSYSGATLKSLIDSGKVRAPIHFPSAIISKELFEKMGGFELYKFSSDSIFVIKLGYLRELTGIGPIPVVDEPLFHWIRQPHSVTTKFENAYTLHKCQNRQRKPLKKRFRVRLLDGELDGANEQEIMKALDLIDNLSNDTGVIEQVSWR